MPSEGVTIELAVSESGEYNPLLLQSVKSRERSVGIARLPACTLSTNQGVSHYSSLATLPFCPEKDAGGIIVINRDFLIFVE